MKKLLPIVLISGTIWLSGCGAATITLQVAKLSLHGDGKTTYEATMPFNTTPDGGFYLNPNLIVPQSVDQADGTSLYMVDGSVAQALQDTAALGKPIAVIYSIVNHGQAASDPAFGDLQIASDFAPDAGNSGPLRRYYHPFLPLAIASNAEIESGCAVHLNPGQQATAILFYPPIRHTATILWGVYGGKALVLNVGDLPPALPSTMQLSSCPPAPSSLPTS